MKQDDYCSSPLMLKVNMVAYITLCSLPNFIKTNAPLLQKAPSLPKSITNQLHVYKNINDPQGHKYSKCM